MSLNKLFLDPAIRFPRGITIQTDSMKFTFTEAQVMEVENELRTIREKFFDVGSVSDQMKRMVIAIYGDENWSTSGYWQRADTIIKRYRLDNPIPTLH